MILPSYFQDLVYYMTRKKNCNPSPFHPSYKIPSNYHPFSLQCENQVVRKYPLGFFRKCISTRHNLRFCRVVHHFILYVLWWYPSRWIQNTRCLVDSIAFHATIDKDIIYYSQARKAADREQFQEAMKREFDVHRERKNWDVVSINDVPEGEKVIDSVWAIRCKGIYWQIICITHKARLNIDGGQQEFAINFYDIFSPVVDWFAIRILLIHAVIFKWHTRQIYFVLTYPQADIEISLYIKMPAGIKVKNETRKQKNEIKKEYIPT